MKKKYIYIIVLIIINLLIIGGSKTYSAYRSSINGSSSVDLAKIVFNNQELTSISLDLDDLIPGSNKEFLFQVKNFNDTDNSEINVGYKISIETLGLIPLSIKLYEGDNLLLDCDDSGVRSDGVITCISSEYILNYESNVSKNYKISLEFPLKDSNNNMWDSSYGNINDYVDVYIDSYQKK